MATFLARWMRNWIGRTSSRAQNYLGRICTRLPQSPLRLKALGWKSKEVNDGNLYCVCSFIDTIGIKIECCIVQFLWLGIASNSILSHRQVHRVSKTSYNSAATTEPTTYKNLSNPVKQIHLHRQLVQKIWVFSNSLVSSSFPSACWSSSRVRFTRGSTNSVQASDMASSIRVHFVAKATNVVFL